MIQRLTFSFVANRHLLKSSAKARRIFHWFISVLILPVLLNLTGCTTSSGTVTSSPVMTSQPVSMNAIMVATASPLPGLEAEKTRLNDRIISSLRGTELFTSVSGAQAGTDAGGGIKIAVEIQAIHKVADNSRQWFGALAGQATIAVQVTVTDLSSGHLIEVFGAEGKSGASARAGTTDEAIQRAAEQVTAEIVKLNAQTGQ